MELNVKKISRHEKLCRYFFMKIRLHNFFDPLCFFIWCKKIVAISSILKVMKLKASKKYIGLFSRHSITQKRIFLRKQNSATFILKFFWAELWFFVPWYTEGHNYIHTYDNHMIDCCFQFRREGRRSSGSSHKICVIWTNHF